MNEQSAQKIFMERAIEAAKKGEGFVHPNPLVGAVIVKDGKIIAEGYHHNYGDLHAERDAIKNAKEKNIDLKGAELYVTLEPCCHFGKQPPCTHAITEEKFSRVIIGSRDPNPLVNGKGVSFLRENGIEVVQDFMKKECDELNEIFFHYVQNKTPYVIVKYAVTADGLTATSAGESKWITNEKARLNVHKTRSNVMAVASGIGTVLKDDPMLNCRLEGNHHQPVRIVLDTNLSLPVNSKLAESASEIPVMVFCSPFADKSKKEQLEKLSVEVLESPLNDEGKISLAYVLKICGEKNIDSILVESGGALNSSLFFENEKCLVNELQLYVGNKIFGSYGSSIFSPVRGKGVPLVSQAISLELKKINTFDSDVELIYKVKSEL